jgi:hypothetical protein
MSSRALAPRLPGKHRLNRGESLLGLALAAVAATAAVRVGAIAIAIPVVIAIVAFFLREPLALLALYLVIGLFKEEAVVQSLPVDATLALGLLLALVCGVRLVSGRVRAVPFGFALTIAVVSLSLAASLAWTSASSYGSEKVTTFLTVTMLAIGAPFFLFERWEDLRRFFTWTVIVAVPVAILALSNPSRDTGRLAGDNTIGTSRLLCTAALILVLGALGGSRWRLPAAALAAGFIAVAAAGARAARSSAAPSPRRSRWRRGWSACRARWRRCWRSPRSASPWCRSSPCRPARVSGSPRPLAIPSPPSGRTTAITSSGRPSSSSTAIRSVEAEPERSAR